MAEFLNSGRIAVAKLVSVTPIHVAWGAGSSGWDTTPVPVSLSDATLVAEIGRKNGVGASFVTPDPAGEIVVYAGKFTASATPTNHIYIATTFDYDMSPGAVVREVGVYVGGGVAPSVPPGQAYTTNPADLTSPGELVCLERFPKITHTASSRQTFRFVISF